MKTIVIADVDHCWVFKLPQQAENDCCGETEKDAQHYINLRPNRSPAMEMERPTLRSSVGQMAERRELKKPPSWEQAGIP